MTLRALHYVVCTQCNASRGPYCDTPEETKEEAIAAGFKVDVKVQNGSLWDFCPSCQEKNKEEAKP